MRLHEGFAFVHAAFLNLFTNLCHRDGDKKGRDIATTMPAHSQVCDPNFNTQNYEKFEFFL